jgi:hypothetical protein
VISALELLPVFTLSPSIKDIPTCPPVQVSVPASFTVTSPSISERVATTDGVAEPPPQPITVETMRIMRASIDSSLLGKIGLPPVSRVVHH